MFAREGRGRRRCRRIVTTESKEKTGEPKNKQVPAPKALKDALREALQKPMTSRKRGV